MPWGIEIDGRIAHVITPDAAVPMLANSYSGAMLTAVCMVEALACHLRVLWVPPPGSEGANHAYGCPEEFRVDPTELW